MRKSIKLLGAVAVAGLVAAGGTAYTAGNTLPDSVAGYGTAAVSGVTVTNIAYTLDTTTIGEMDAIVFTETEDVRNVVAAEGVLAVNYQAILTLSAGTGTRTTCAHTVEGTITCTLPDATPINATTNIALAVTTV